MVSAAERQAVLRPRKYVALAKLSREYDATSTVTSDEVPSASRGAEATGPTDAPISRVVLHDGRLIIDGQEVAGAQFSTSFVRFAEQGPHGVRSGLLNFTQDGLAFDGHVMSENGMSQRVVGVTPPSVYDTQFALPSAQPAAGSTFPTGWTPSTPADAPWTAGVQFRLGYKVTAHGAPVLHCAVIDTATGAHIPVSVAPSAPPNENYDLQLVMNPMDPSLLSGAIAEVGTSCPASFTILFNWNGDTFDGVLQVGEPADGGWEVGVNQYEWTGAISTQVKASERTDLATRLEAAAPPSTVIPSDLSVVELFGLQPDPDDLKTAQFSMVVDNLKWSIAQDPGTASWLNDFFAQEPPVLGIDRTKLISLDAPFYNSRFAVGFIGNSVTNYTGPGAPKTNLSPAQSNDLQYYLCAGLAAEPGYTRQTNGVFLDAFISVTPRLAGYLQSDPEGWAKQLFAALTTTQQTNITVAKIIGGAGLTEANRHSVLLQALQPSGDLAKNYHKRLVASCLAEAVHSLDLTSKTAVESWLGDSIQAFITAYEAGQLTIPGADPAAQLALNQMAADLRAAVEAAGSVADLAGACADVIVAAQGGDLWTVLSNAQSTLLKAGYAFAGGIYLIAFAGGIFSAVQAFKSWDSLNDTQRADAIVSIVALTAQIVEKVPQIIEAGQLSYTTLLDLYSWSRGTLGESLAEGMESIPFEEGDIFGDGAVSLAEMAGEGGEMVVEGTTWATAFAGTVGVVCKCIGVAAAAAFAVITTIDFVNDFSNGADIDTKALDGITSVATCLVAMCAVAALEFSAVCIPIVGAVLAVIGLVAGLIKMFTHQTPPPSPAEVFVKDTLLPAVPPSPSPWILPAPVGWGKGDPVPAGSLNPYAVASGTAPALA